VQPYNARTIVSEVRLDTSENLGEAAGSRALCSDRMRTVRTCCQSKGLSGESHQGIPCSAAMRKFGN
jgi:hypothetical protein